MGNYITGTYAESYHKKHTITDASGVVVPTNRTGEPRLFDDSGVLSVDMLRFMREQSRAHVIRGDVFSSNPMNANECAEQYANAVATLNAELLHNLQSGKQVASVQVPVTQLSSSVAKDVMEQFKTSGYATMMHSDAWHTVIGVTWDITTPTAHDALVGAEIDAQKARLKRFGW